ncbi:hypothetical protein P1J78_04205 [Psychromarinibacter sp. C21-152]|uniref:Uncharacterized protein n=1 Tax=Psychromarinibacter sediminicola TaxID=3033385 RepID=A0AAE3NQ26_9RHOB|nr:hypothetical protein [Psychromarinibacter sediminicola]MDF0599926.1 hypothetical protein [Psychromarinibacter sediminicola]
MGAGIGQNRGLRAVGAALTVAWLWAGPAFAQSDGFTVLDGRVAPGVLCPTARFGCEVVADRVRLTVDHVAGVAAGIGLARVTYAPYSDCPDWDVLTYMEFAGTVTEAGRAAGRVESRTVVEMAMPAGAGCMTERRAVPDSGTWTLAWDADGAAQAMVAFRSGGGAGTALDLSATWQAEPPPDVTGAGCAMDAPGLCTPDFTREFLGRD